MDSIKIDNLVKEREHWIDKDDRIVRAMDRLAEKGEKKALDKWTKAWLKNDKQELKNWEREFAKD